MNSLHSYPVFPDWIFTGELAITDEMATSVVSEVSSMEKIQTPYGYDTSPGTLTKNVFNMSRLMGQVFFDNVLSKFRLPAHLRNIESVDSHVMNIKPGFGVNTRINRHRWYNGAVFLNAETNCSDIYLDTLDNRLYSIPPGVQEYQHIIKAKKYNMAFWPAHIPWGLTENRSKSGTLIYTTTFIIKR